MVRSLRCLFVAALLPVMASAARPAVADSSIAISAIAFTGSYQLPAGDMSDRFGNNFSVGATFLRKTASNWVWNVEGSYFFGSDVKENTILSEISTSQGYVIGADGGYAEIYLNERGYNIMAKAGKLLPVIGPNDNSGILLMAGGGFIEHRIMIEDKANLAPQLSDEYRKGYDRLTNGWCLSQFAGYAHFSDNRRINFFAGVEVMEGFTQNRRSVNFDTGLKDDTRRTDILIGIKVGWMIPLSKRSAQVIYYN